MRLMFSWLERDRQRAPESPSSQVVNAPFAAAAASTHGEGPARTGRKNAGEIASRVRPLDRPERSCCAGYGQSC